MSVRAVPLISILVASLVVWFAGIGSCQAGSWGAEIDNDRIVKTDRHFTHGTRFSWVSDNDETPGWARDLAGALPRIDGPGTLRLGAAIGQNMFTPDDISNADIIADDRPYAGWLYGGLALEHTAKGNRRTWELDLGIVGPGSLARQTQILVHEVLGATIPRGWANQLRNEPGIVLLYEEMWQRTWPIDANGPRIAVTPHISGSIGNIYTHAAAGGSIRFGVFGDDDFGPARIRPGVPGSDGIARRDGFGWYLFAGAEGRLVGRNIFLDGNTFTDSHSIDKVPGVLDMQTGVGVAFHSMRLTVMHVFRTHEFKHQAEADRFGVAQATFRF